MLFGRIKPLEAILATAEKKSLHRSLGPVQLTMLGIGAVIGTGIFVLTATAAQKAGPGMMLSFVIAGVFIMGVVQNAMNLKNVDPFYQYVVSGTILLLAVLFDRVKQMRSGTAN